MIRIVNFLLTRRCNLDCSYCAITKNYSNLPHEYPEISRYHKREITFDEVKEVLTLLKKHNKDIFIIFYGGEPLLRNDLPKIVSYCNTQDIQYTIITNNCDELTYRSNILINNFEVKGLSSSVDPLIYDLPSNDDRYKKSISGLKKLIEMKKKIKDVVAEITVTKDNVKHLYRLVKELTDNGISSSITFIDIAKNPYYDFSNIRDNSLMVENTQELRDQFQKIYDDNLDVHMGKKLMDNILSILPANYNCNLEDKLHNITIDANGFLRTCLRIRGTHCPDMWARKLLIQPDGIENFKKLIKLDKEKYCQGCNWTCPMMSDFVDNDNDTNSLIHLDKRRD